MQSRAILILDDVPLEELIKSKLESSLSCQISHSTIITKNQPLLKILDDIGEKSPEAEAIYINAHLAFKEFPHRHQCGGIELFKHIRLMPTDSLQDFDKEFSEAFDKVRLLPVILGILHPLEHYVRAKVDNVIILSPGCKCIRLPELANTQISPEDLCSFEAFENLQEQIKDYVVFTSEDEISTEHDYRNKAGVARFLKEFCELSVDGANSVIQNYNCMLKTSLWLKKKVFFEDKNKPLEKSDGTSKTQQLKDLCAKKKFLYIDDEHRFGWSSALYAGLLGGTPKIETFQKEEAIIITEDRCFSVIDSYQEAESFFMKEKCLVEKNIKKWSEAEYKYLEKKREYRNNSPRFKSALEEAEKDFDLKTKYLQESRTNEELSKNALDEASKSFEESAHSLRVMCAEMYTSNQEDSESQEFLDIIQKTGDYWKELVSVREKNQKAIKESEEKQKAFEESKQKREICQKQYDNAEQSLEEAKESYNNAKETLDKFSLYALIFLDLRLEQSDKERAIEQISGIRLLKQIRELNPGIPIIIFTASEKVLSYRTAMELGADGYWIKNTTTGMDLKDLIARYLDKEKDFKSYAVWIKIKQIETKKEIHGYTYTTKSQVRRMLGESERANINDLLRGTFFLLKQEVSELAFYNWSVLNMKLIQEIRYRHEKEEQKANSTRPTENEAWRNLITRNTIPEAQNENKLRQYRNKIAHVRQDAIVEIRSASHDDAIEFFKFTLERLLSNP